MKKRVVLVTIVALLSLVLGAGAVTAQEAEPQALPKLHVSQITLTGRPIQGGNQVWGGVWIQDDQGNPAPDAMVFVHAWKPIKIPVFGVHVTKPDGRAAWTMNSQYQGWWTLCVVGVVKWGYVYDPASNNNTCEEIFYP